MPLRNTLVTTLLVVSAATVDAGEFGAGAKGPGRTSHITTAAGVTYSRLERKLDSGTTVVGYADKAGTMFAVAWSGPFLPDLRQLLGPHFEMLSRAQARAPGLHAPVVVRGDEVVIVSQGHMGAFEGRAWLPARLPAGFDPRTFP